MVSSALFLFFVTFQQRFVFCVISRIHAFHSLGGIIGLVVKYFVISGIYFFLKSSYLILSLFSNANCISNSSHRALIFKRYLSVSLILSINICFLIHAAIKDTVNDVLIKGQIPDITLSETDNLGEVVEKLCILHIRTWMLEDAAQEATTDEELGSLKRKIDICFKQKRPRLVQAINRQVSDAIVNNTSLVEDSVKLYKGVQ